MMIDADSYRTTVSGLTGAVAWESLGRLEHEAGFSKQPANGGEEIRAYQMCGISPPAPRYFGGRSPEKKSP